jgi:undecaprenyl-diphosphatase
LCVVLVTGAAGFFGCYLRMARLDLPERSRPRHIAIPVVALAALWLAMLTMGVGGADSQLLALLYSRDQPSAAAIARALTFFGEGEVVVLISVVAAAWLLWQGRARSGLILIGVTLLGRALIWAQKYGIGRLRPDEEVHLVQVYSLAFPSAHAGNSMIVYLAIALLLTAGTPWQRLTAAAAICFAILIGLSRTMLGVHWPSDVIGGWAFGLLWVLIALPLAERLATK